MRLSNALRCTLLSLFPVFILLSGCTESTHPDDDDDSSICNTVEWDLLLTSDEINLSAYQLFAFANDPTSNPRDTGMPYQLNTELFTDYSSKYRFVFMPCGTAATYVNNESFIFPVGTVITKTFSMPDDTSARGYENETLIETRIIIKREAGWVTLPYVWLPDGSDAILDTSGQTIAMSVTHNGTLMEFNYVVPSQATCVACHVVNDEITPIGTKARNLNRELDFDKGLENQLLHWQNAEQLTGLPAEINTIETMPAFNDDTDLALLTTEAERERFAKAYLDINCSHCHREGGGYDDTVTYLEYWRDIDVDVPDDDHGICDVIIPGNAGASNLLQYVQVGYMPLVGTTLVHEEGLALIEYWIDNMSRSCETQ